jgi:ATP-dependent exoDNAse (exonuclease V) alpha subunit
VVALNNALQARLNPPVNDSHEFDVFAGSADEGRYSIRTGDRVIQTRNNYELGPVMNGEMGTVVAADPNGLNVQAFMDARWTGKETPVEGAEAEGDDAELDGEETLPGGVVRAHDDDGEAVLRWKTPRVVVVNYGDRMIAYTKDEARELHLGYAITVHKSQGSQFKAIVIALHCENVRMLSRPLLYTAITRAEKYVLMVGTTDQVTTAARNTRGVERRTTLQDRLVKAPRNM